MLMGKKIYRALFWTGICSIMVYTPLALGAVPKRVWSISSTVFLIYSLLILWLWGERRRIERTSLDLPIFLFIGLAAISAVFSIYKYASLQALIRLLAYAGLFYLVINNLDAPKKRLLAGLAVSMGVILSIYGMLQFAGALPHPWWACDTLLSSTYVNHNHFAGYLELAIPAALGMAITEKGRMRRVLIASLTVMAAAFVFAQSRGAWVSLSISILFMQLVLVKKKVLGRKSIAAFVLLIVLIILSAYVTKGLVFERMSSMVESPAGDASLAMRLKIWEGAAGIVNTRPFTGTGIGTFEWAMPKHRPPDLSARARFAHNDYLHMAAEMGLLAPLLMACIAAVAVFKSSRSGAGSRIDPVRLGCGAGILSVALHGIVDFNFHIPANMILLTIYAAIAVKETGFASGRYAAGKK
jgi:O-antigen ligase